MVRDFRPDLPLFPATSFTRFAAMPFLPQPWSKKRGSRLAARVFSGVVGEALFYAFLFLIGVFAVTLTIAGRFTSGGGPAVPIGIGFWSFLITSIALLITGGGGLAYRILRVGASSERRSALARRTGSLDLVGRPARQTRALPNVPQGGDLGDSPGIRLAYRLPSTASPVTRVAAAAVLALLWCGVWVVLAVVAVTGIWMGTPRPMLTFLLLPLGGIGIWTARYFLRQLRESAGVGATIVEISDNPLRPSSSYRLFVAQFGKLRLRRLRVTLVCEEESIFRQGTDVRIDRHLASETVICNEKNVSIDPEAPWEEEFELKVPPRAMHSFQSPHNAVHWKVVVSGESRPWPSFSRSFPVVVHPPCGAGTRDRR